MNITWWHKFSAPTGHEWAEPYAETARRRALDAWTTIAEILQPCGPDEALSAVETALAHDPYNEYLYQRIMRLQAAAGRPEKPSAGPSPCSKPGSPTWASRQPPRPARSLPPSSELPPRAPLL
jgi:hypothetical protein